jgi:hypothetical protein
VLHHQNLSTSGSRKPLTRTTLRPQPRCTTPTRARVVRLDQVHGSDAVARGAAGIRETMAGYIGLRPHTDVVVHHTTASRDFALCRAQPSRPRRFPDSRHQCEASSVARATPSCCNDKKEERQ